MYVKKKQFFLFIGRVYFLLLVDAITIQEVDTIQIGLIDMIHHETCGDLVIL